MARYYKSLGLDRPAVYVQDEQGWRGYVPNGALQRSNGPLPDVILARTVEITKDEAEALLAGRVTRSREPAAGAAPVPADVAPTLHSPFARPRRRLYRRPVYLIAGAAAVLVVAAVVVLFAGGYLGTGAAASRSGPGSAGAAGDGDAILTSQAAVATVGGQAISGQRLAQKIADFEAEFSSDVPNKATAPDQYKAFEEDVLDYLVAYQIVSQKAAALSISVTDQDVQARMALMLESFDGDQAKLESAVKQQGLTMEQFERTYEESMLFNAVSAEVTKSVTVTGSEVQTYYNQHKSDSYAGKALADVKAEIQSKLLDSKQQQSWRDWLGQQRQTVSVTYANGWKAPANPDTLVP